MAETICVDADDRDKQVLEKLCQVYRGTRGWLKSMVGLYVLMEIRCQGIPLMRLIFSLVDVPSNVSLTR